jgi:hypothetical protein
MEGWLSANWVNWENGYSWAYGGYVYYYWNLPTTSDYSAIYIEYNPLMINDGI